MRNSLSILLLFVVCAVIGGCTNDSLQTYDLRCENLENPLSIDADIPHLSWKLKTDKQGEKQTAFQLLVATDPSLLKPGKADLWDSGKKSSSESVMVKYGGGKLSSHPLVYWKVRVWDSSDKEGSWSKPAVFGMGLSSADIEAASYITLPDTTKASYPFIRKQFEYDGKSDNILLYINQLGYYDVFLNGKKIGEDVLAPAVSQLNKRAIYNTYDITRHLKKGKNDLVIRIGQGWYKPAYYGSYKLPLVKAWVKKNVDGNWSTWFVSDKSWKAAKSGYGNLEGRRQLWGGEVDASVTPEDMTVAGLDKLEWFAADEVNVGKLIISPQMVEGNRISGTIKAKGVKQLSDSVWLVDMGQALTGWAEVKFPPLTRGQKIQLTFADHINDRGDLPNQGQSIVYIASGKTGEVFSGKLHSYCFQYVKISNLETAPNPNDITASLIQTGFGKPSSFECSDQDMNAIHDMVQYTLQNLSLGGYLVDCQHIERLGYGGDGNASLVTAQTMFDLAPLYTNWMQAWEDVMREGGSLPHVAPNPHSAGGGPYWCGFVITAPWQTYVNYGDSRLIEKYYPIMQRWLEYVAEYSKTGLLEPWPSTYYRNWYLGDWATPIGIDQVNPASISVVNNCFISICYETMEKIAKVIGKYEDIKVYAEKRIALQKMINETLYSEETGIYGTGSQIDLVYPMLSGVTPKELTGKVTQNLFYETEHNRAGHLSTGLVGVPVITEWAVKNNQPDFIYSMLKKREYPGYLYMIDNGATATWEHWNGERSRLHNCYNGIGSWFYQAIGGILPDENEPGYRKIWISPQIPKGITWAKTSKETPFGPLSVNWNINDNAMNMDLEIPTGSTAYVVLPLSVSEYTLNGKVMARDGDNVILEGGKYTLKY